MMDPSDLNKNGTRDVPTRSAVPQPTAPPHTFCLTGSHPVIRYRSYLRYILHSIVNKYIKNRNFFPHLSGCTVPFPWRKEYDKNKKRRTCDCWTEISPTPVLMNLPTLTPPHPIITLSRWSGSQVYHNKRGKADPLRWWWDVTWSAMLEQHHHHHYHHSRGRFLP